MISRFVRYLTVPRFGLVAVTGVIIACNTVVHMAWWTGILVYSAIFIAGMFAESALTLAGKRHAKAAVRN